MSILPKLIYEVHNINKNANKIFWTKDLFNTIAKMEHASL